MIKYFIILVLALIFILCAMLGRNHCSASSLPEKETKIEENNIKIQQCEEIKKQLHITAEAIRKQDFYDKDFVKSLSDKWFAQDALLSMLIEENRKLKQEINSYQFIGNFTITHYCNQQYSHICNSGYPYKTATGTTPTPGRTIAVDPRKIPYGTRVVIDGHIYIAEDCGGAIKGNKIDICVGSHNEAMRKGVRKNVPVYIIKN